MLRQEIILGDSMAQKGLNKVTLIGNVGQDPELRTTSNGQAVANLSIATSEAWKTSSGENQERTEWHRVVLFGRLAEITRDYISKGGKIYLEGSLRTRKWEDKNGQDRFTTEIVANELIMLDSRRDSAQPTSSHTSSSQGAVENAQMLEDDIPF